MEIFYLMPGSASITLFIEGNPYILSERDMLIVPSSAVHRIEAPDKNNKVLRLDIGYPLLGENFRPFTERRFINPLYSFSHLSCPELGRIESIFQAVAGEKLVMSEKHQDDNDTATIVSRMRVSAYLYQIASILLESLPSCELSATDKKKRHTVQII